MSYAVKRSDDEIDQQMNAAAAGIDRGSKLSGMSYEEGVHEALNWVLGFFSDAPLNPADYEENV